MLGPLRRSQAGCQYSSCNNNSAVPFVHMPYGCCVTVVEQAVSCAIWLHWCGTVLRCSWLAYSAHLTPAGTARHQLHLSSALLMSHQLLVFAVAQALMTARAGLLGEQQWLVVVQSGPYSFQIAAE